MLDYFRDEMSAMFETALDEIDRSNNTMVQYMNRRADHIRDAVSAAMHDEGMMEFTGMALGFPLAGLGLAMLGAPAPVLALFSVAAPMTLLGHLTNGASDHTPPEHHIFHINRTIHVHDGNQDENVQLMQG